ncbi:hypothetical protein [Gallaecimonas pentaromativorans]|uniref:hypothetical protein n=1 Tax=Gallaecimonas pentaromativorans TaxID=584787 RepID=UPI003A936C97
MNNLVICCVGDGSLHPQWLEGQKDFDLFLIYFGGQSGLYREQCQHYAEAKGSKWQLLSSQIAANWDWIKEYDAIWLPDDDIKTDAANINRIFALFHQYQLKLAQPALTPDSYISLKITRQRNWAQLRFTNYVEVMVPVMTSDTLEMLLPTFTLNKTGWGVDYYWNKLVRERGWGPLGIIDAAAVTHTRPVNPEGGYYQAMGISPGQERDEIMRRYKLSKKKRHYGAVMELAGRAVKLRWLPYIF